MSDQKIANERMSEQTFSRALEVFREYGRMSWYDQVVFEGPGVFSIHREIFATFTWHGNIPVFKFQPTKFVSQDLVDHFTYRQYVLRPYVDDPYVSTNATYYVQEVRRCLTFDEALAIRHVRDKLNGEWNDVTVRPETVEKIKDTLRKVSFSRIQEQLADDWQHFALCAIFEI